MPLSFLTSEVKIMSKGQDSKKATKKPATKTMKEKHDAKKVKKAAMADPLYIK